MVASQKNLDVSYGPGIPLLSILKQNKTKQLLERTYPMSIAALFTVAKIWKQLKCLSTK